MQVTNTNQTQIITKTNMNTQQVTLTAEEILLIKEILPRFGSVERLIEAHTEDIALLKAKKGKSKKRELTEQEIAAKQRKQEEKAAKKLAASQAKAEKEAAKEAAKEAKKLEKEKANAEKAAAKEAKKLEAEKVKAQKAATKGPSFDKTFTKKCFVKYRDHKDKDAYKGLNGSRLRIARKNDGSDNTVYKVAPHNWTDDANAEFDKLENKWDANTKAYSPEFVPKKSTPKTTTKPKKKKKKVLLSQKVAVSDTDEELDEEKPVDEIPEEYGLYRRYLKGDKSAQTTWRKATAKSHKTATASGLKALDNWAYKKTGGGTPYQDKIYEKDPYEKVPDEGKDILNDEGKFIGNCVSSFTPVEDKKPAAVEESDDEESDEESNDNKAATIEDDDGLEEFSHPMYFDKNLKIRNSDNAIFDSDKPKEDAFMGYYNEDTTEIVAEIEESEDDGFSSDDMKDTEQF